MSIMPIVKKMNYRQKKVVDTIALKLILSYIVCVFC